MGISTDDSGMGLSAFHRGVYQVRTGADAGGGSAGGGGGSSGDAALSAHISASDPHPQYINVSQKGVANGVATLGENGQLLPTQLPPVIASGTLAAHVDPGGNPHPQYIKADDLAAALLEGRARRHYFASL